MTASNDQEQANEAIARWAPLVTSEEESKNRMPVTTLQNEALHLSALVVEYLHPVKTDTTSRPGLSTMVDSGMLPESIAKDIQDLGIAVGEAQARYGIISQRLSNAPSENADNILDEMRASLAFLLEDGMHPDGEAQLDNLRDRFSRISSQEVMAAALEGYAELCEFHHEDLKKLPTYEPDIGNQALRAAKALRQRFADRNLGKLLQEQREVMELRNRLITALQTRMNLVRRAVRFLFRDYPAIVRQAGSTYERERRRASRRTKSQKESTQSAPAVASY